MAAHTEVTIAGYELEARVGRGGMGVVWRARQRSLDRLVAVKLIGSDAADDEVFRERFLREAKLAASLEHPNVLPVYEAGESEGRLFLAMRLVDGADLASIVQAEGPLDAGRAVALVRQIAAALDAAHAKGLIHRDVKPANVMVESEGPSEHAYLTDFGIAKATSATRALTQTGQLVGTAGYLAPEVIQSDEVGPGADVYALACMLFELLTGRTPFERDSDVATVWAQVQEEPPPLGDGLPAVLDAVVRRGLAKRPGERFQSAGELASAAAAALADPRRWVTPPPPVAEWPRGLPTPASPMVGREQELAQLTAMLASRETRLLTITGPGGSGKTRLALELAARTASHYDDGAYFVALASIQEPALVASAIAQALGLRESGARSREEMVQQRLREAECLVLLDNVEHLIPAASPLLAKLAQATDRSRLLATSRAALAITGEQEYPLHALPPSDAAALFETRARAVKPSLAFDDETATMVASICKRLDGLPLAIELAAARVRLLSPRAILARLDERLALLTGGPTDVPARQQTLRATIDWSHDMLEPEQQRLFARLSVFPAGARIEAVESVCSADLDSLDALVRHSLVVARDDPDGEPRFSMLETIREYAATQLEASGDAERALRARTECLRQLVGEVDLDGHNQIEWLERLDAEHDNVRAALAWALEHDQELAGGIGAATWEYWLLRGHLREGREHLSRVIAATSPESLARAVAMVGDANLAVQLGQEQEGLQISRKALEMLETSGNRKWIARALIVLTACEAYSGDYARIEQRLDQAIAIAREDCDDFALASALVNLGWLRFEAGCMGEAAELYEAALHAWEQAGSTWGIAMVENNLGCVRVSLGDMDGAEELLRHSIPSLAGLGIPWHLCVGLDELAISFARGRGDDARAARLLGARDRLAADLGTVMPWYTDNVVVTQIRGSLGAEAYTEAYTEGRAMTLDQIVNCALGSDQPVPSSDSTL